MHRQSELDAQSTSSPWIWIVAALGAHTGWGAYPVFARYLQTVSRLPSMSLLFAGSLLALALLTIALWSRLDRRLFRSQVLWVFAGIVVLRSITNLLAARYTLSIYVQLITLMTPFVVALLSATVFRDRIPPYTGRAITLALVGSLLMMSGDVGQAGVRLALTAGDWLGIALATVSMVFLSLYMIVVRRTAQNDVPAEAVFLVQLVVIAVVSLPLSLVLGEEWQRWQTLQLADWLVFGGFSVGVLLGANVAQISALRYLGAPMVSSLLAWRLVSALVVAGLLLDERLTSLWQIAGAGIVLITITWYLWQQRDPADGTTAKGSG